MVTTVSRHQQSTDERLALGILINTNICKRYFPAEGQKEKGDSLGFVFMSGRTREKRYYFFRVNMFQ